MIAIGVLKGLQEHGIRVPEQISVAGFDNIIFSAYTNPPLTTFDQPKRFIGAEAARLMLDLLLCSDPASLSQRSVRVLQGRLLPRQSTGPFNPRQT
jgi:DNA-binding LacI/PurR family transcriptional regulator